MLVSSGKPGTDPLCRGLLRLLGMPHTQQPAAGRRYHRHTASRKASRDAVSPPHCEDAESPFWCAALSISFHIPV